MTPSQLFHLRAIDAHLSSLLSIASKRTPGGWEQCSEGVAQKEGYLHIACDPNDAAYIAACAGQAEAGWRATKASIKALLHLYESTEGYADGAPDSSAHDLLCNEVSAFCSTALNHILSEWPLESLTLP